MDASNDLDHLATKYGSDKFGWHYYTPAYHRHFQSLRHEDITLLEIGIGGYADPAAGGASLRMWHEYFTRAQIFGLDFFDKSSLAEGRMQVFKGSQADPRAITTVLDASRTGLLDIVVDDGSHRSEHIITSFLMLFPYVADNGWYVVEDTATAYLPEYGQERSYTSDRLNTMRFFQQLTHGMNHRHGNASDYQPGFFDLNISSIYFYHELIFVRKGSPA